jgi:hypothetical protein
MRRATWGGMFAWCALLCVGATGAWILGAFHHPMWAVVVGAWIGCAAAMSVVLVATVREPAADPLPVSEHRELETVAV